MSSSIVSSISTSRASKPSMSRTPSVATAGLRRLTIQQDSNDDMVETRSQAKKGESSNSKKDKGKRKATSGSSPKSRRDEAAKSRKAPSKKGGQPSDDSSSSSSEDEDDVPVTQRDIMRKLMSVTNPDDVSSTEFVYSPGPLPARSRQIRGIADVLSRLPSQVFNEAYQLNRPDGPAWANQACGILERQKESAEDDFKSGEADAIATIQRFDKIYESVHFMFTRQLFRDLHVSVKPDFLHLLVDILNFIVRESVTRGQRNQIQTQYVGNNYEGNIHLRFLTRKEVQRRYADILHSLARLSGIRAMFRVQQVHASLSDTWRRVCHYVEAIPSTHPMSPPMRSFQDWLEHFLQTAQIACNRTRPFT